MEKFADNLLVWSTKRYLAKSNPKIVVITGSVGKTSTTQAIATVLAQKYKVNKTKYNYNTLRGVVMTIFDEESKTSRLAWLLLVMKILARSVISKPDFQVAVLELGTDQPGDIARFDFLKPSLAIVTAVTPEHMEFFGSIDAVAKEELSVSKYTGQMLVNADLVDKKYLDTLQVISYGQGQTYSFKKQGQVFELVYGAKSLLKTNVSLIGRSGDSALTAAGATGIIMDLNVNQVAEGLAEITPVPGRMNRLVGKKGSIIVDDSYNSSPEAAKSALDYLYQQKASQKIVLLGNMNEMGELSANLHSEVGSYCDPKQINLLVTLGKEANEYLAKSAENKGCKVWRTNTPKEAGEYILNALSNDAIILVKGSQNGVYAEEAVKLLLADPADTDKLVRQTSYWPAKKGKLFVDLYPKTL